MTYEIQGRRTARGPDGRPREIVRLATAADRAAAFAVADSMTADRLTVWVFARERRADAGSAYTLLATIAATS